MRRAVDATDVLRDAHVVLLIDWPSRDVPEALARSGLEVIFDPTGERDPRGCWQLPDELSEARRLVESAGLTFVSEAYIADAARSLR